MLQAQQDGKGDPAVEESRLFPSQDNRQHQQSIEKAIVLEMNMIDNQKTGRKENRKSGDICKLFIGLGRGLDKSELASQC